MRRSIWLLLLGTPLVLFVTGGFAQSPKKPGIRAPQAINLAPFRSADGRITGWKVKIPGARPLASPAIAEGKVFVGGGFGSHEFYAFDASTGRQVWKYRTSDDGPTAAAVDNGIIAFNTESCELEILTTDGKPLWKKWLGDPLMSMPAMAGGTVYMAYPNSRGDHKYYVAAFDAKTGKEIWKHSLTTEIITAPIIERDRLYIATLDGLMLSLSRLDGSKIWEEKKNATSAPAVWKDQVYFSRRDETSLNKGGKVVAQQTELFAARTIAPRSVIKELPSTRRNADYLDYSKRAKTQAEQQNQAFDASVGFAGANKGSALMAPAQANIAQASVHGIWAYQGSKPFIDRGLMYSSMGDRTQSVELETGKVIWSRTFDEARRASSGDYTLTPPSIVNGKAFIGTSSGEIYAISAKTGDVLWKVDLGEPVSFPPVIAKGRVCIATNQGSLFCLETGDPRDDGWLMWGANAAHNGILSR